MSKFGNILRSLRIRENMTQEELAVRVGVARSAIGMYEQGKREPNQELLEKFADFFNVDLCTKSISVPEISESIDERKIVYDFYELSWIDQIDILAQLSLITKETSTMLDPKMIGEAINRAREQDKFFELHKKILNKLEENS